MCSVTLRLLGGLEQSLTFKTSTSIVGNTRIKRETMYFTKSLLALAMAAASLGGAYAKLDLSSTSNVVVYWGMFNKTTLRWIILTPPCVLGQNSFKGKGELAQQSLGYYCNGETGAW